MKQLIDKSDLTAEIEKKKDICKKVVLDLRAEGNKDYYQGKTEAYSEISLFINTLETKEVDEKTISNDLESAALLYYPKMSRISEPHGIIPADNKSHYLGDANEDNRKAFIVGAQWQKEQDQPTIELAEEHAYFAGCENTREKLIEKACEWLKDNWSKHVWLDGDNIIHFGLWENDFRKAMEE